MKLFRGLVSKIESSAARVLHEAELALISADANTAAAPLFNGKIMDAHSFPKNLDPSQTYIRVDTPQQSSTKRKHVRSDRPQMRKANGEPRNKPVTICAADLGFGTLVVAPKAQSTPSLELSPASSCRRLYPNHRPLKLSIRYAYIREVRVAAPDHNQPFSLTPRRRSQSESSPPRCSVPDSSEPLVLNCVSATYHAIQLYVPMHKLEPSYCRISSRVFPLPQPFWNGLHKVVDHNGLRSATQRELSGPPRFISGVPQPSRFLMKPPTLSLSDARSPALPHWPP
jgi:hypothetical protein